MDKNALLIRLSELGRFWREDFDSLSPPEQVFRAIWELEGAVNNGGFDQYFFNGSGDTAFAVVDSLTAIGAARTARIVARANAVFPASTPPRDGDERQALLADLAPEQRALLQSLDEEFLRYPDDLTELLHSYVERHRADVAGTSDVGI